MLLWQGNARNGNKRSGDARGNVEKEGRELDYLGYCFMRGNVRMRKSIKKNFARKAHRLKSEKRRREVLSSYKGWCKWGNCRHLWKTITNTEMSFAEKGITGRDKTKDGQEFYDIMQVKGDEIVNLPIKVLSFIPNIKTKHGPGRYAVKLIVDGHERKWITGSVTIISMLEQAKARGFLPSAEGISTTLRSRNLGGGVKDYVFD